MEEKYKIHSFYVLLIFVATIILLLTVKWATIPNLSNYITFALTLTSLVLAVLAITYAFYSNSSLSQTISTINHVSADVSSTAKGLVRATDDLTNRIESIPSRLETVEGKVDQANLMLQQYSQRKEEAPVTQKEKKAADAILDPFMNRTSASGLSLLYACALAFSKKLPFSLSELCSAVGNTDPAYAQGYLVAATSVGLIQSAQSKGIWNITGVSDGMGEKARAELERRISSKVYTSPVVQRISEFTNRADQYFTLPIEQPPESSNEET